MLDDENSTQSKKTIMKESEIASKYQKTKILKITKKQRNISSKLYKKEIRKFHNNLNVKDITDNKKFRKTLKPLISDKVTCGSSKINLVIGGIPLKPPTTYYRPPTNRPTDHRPPTKCTDHRPVRNLRTRKILNSYLT